MLRRPSVRAIPYLGVAALIGYLTNFFEQNWAAWLIIVSFASVGLFLLWRRPREVVAWLLVLAGFLFPWVGSPLPGSASQVIDGNADLAITLFAWCNAWCSNLFFWSFVALAVVFPSGRLPAGHLGLAGRIAVGVPVAVAIALAFGPNATITFSDGTSAVVRLPLAVAPDWPGWAIVQAAAYLAVLGALVVSISTLLVRFRRARGSERAQMKWLLAALAAVLGSVTFAFAIAFLVDPVGIWMWIPALLAFPLIPITVGIAIRRYHLYDIDRIVSRTIAYLAVTGLLLAVFVAGVVGLQALLAGLTQGQTLAVAASTLIAFALFQPVRRRVQLVVDRRFDRARYDAGRTADAFAARLRGRVELAGVEADIVETVAGALRPNSAAVWVRRGSGR
jgi:hypothetical protein